MTHRTMGIGSCFFVASLWGCAAGRTNVVLAPGDKGVAARFATQLDALRNAAGIPGLAVAILRDTTVILARGFGFADVARRVPVTKDTPFNIASVTKPISAVVALRLAQDGILNLDKPMRGYRGFPEFCDDVRKEGGIFFRDYACEENRLTLRNVLSMTANGDPGTRFWYNPPSYSWASRPMAEVTGVAFSTLVDSLIFRPAAMRSSARQHRRLPLRPDLADALAVPYHLGAKRAPVKSDPPPPQGDGAAGGVISTAADLARFDVALADGRLLRPEWRARLWTRGESPSGAPLPYGIGWFLAEYRGRTLAWHAGLWEGQYSALYLKVLSDDPRERMTLILLANSDGLKWDSRLDEAAIERSPFATAFLGAFDAPTSSRPAVPDSIVLERTPCFGFCPAYHLSLASSGRVVFSDGQMTAVDSISRKAFADLYSEFEQLQFASLPESIRQDREMCTPIATDMPSAELTVFAASRKKAVNDYHGCFGSTDSTKVVLRRLRLLEDRVDSVTQSQRWIKPSTGRK